MSYPELLLSNQICFLVYRLEREILGRYRPLLAEIGLTYPQYLAMLVLWEEDVRSVGAMCTALSLDTGTVSPLLKRLEAAGFITRSRENNDERNVTIRLTDLGKALEEKAREIPGAFASCLGINLNQYKELHATMSDLLARV